MIESWKRFFVHDAKPFFFPHNYFKICFFLFLTTMMMNPVYFLLTLQADNQVKRGEGVTRLEKREHARRAFTAFEQLSFISDSTDGQLNHTATAVECLQEVVMQRASYHFCGAQGMDVPNTVGFVVFFVVIFFGAQLLKRSQQSKNQRSLIKLHDGQCRQMGKKTLPVRPVHVDVESTPAKPLVDGEFWDTSERRVQWSVYEMEKTRPGGKATPGILKKPTYGMGVGFGVGTGARVGTGTGAHDEAEAEDEAGLGTTWTGADTGTEGVGTWAAVVTWPGVGEGAEPEVVLGTIWVPHPKHGLVRRSARLVSRPLR
jgi:hypothetical protein